jgi:hypothetical protein
MTGPNADIRETNTITWFVEQVDLARQTDEEFYNVAELVIRRGQDLIRRATDGLSTFLTGFFGRGYSVRNLMYSRKFYLTYRDDGISQTQFARLEGSASLPTVSTGRKVNLSWSHHLCFMRIPILPVAATRGVS